MKFILFLTLFLGQMLAFAQVPTEAELPYLIIPPHELPARLKEFEKQQVHKIVLKGCAKQPAYQVIIGDPPSNKKTKWQLYRVDLKVSYNQTEKEFDILASLVEARKEKIFNSISEKKISELEFFRRLEEVIDRLFLPPVYSSDDIQDIETEQPSRPKPEAIIAVVPESRTANINFRERIMNLKQDVNVAVAQAKQAKQTKKNDSGKTSDDNKKKLNNDANKNEKMELNPLLDKTPKPPKPAPPIDTGHSVRLGYYSFDTASKHLIETDSHPRYLLVDYEFARAWSHQSNFYHHLNIRYGKTLNKEEKEFAPYMGFALLEGYHVRFLGWMPKVGIEMDTISFKNLPESGKGMKIANNQITWFNLSSVNNFSLFGQGFRFSAAYSVPLMVKSDYQALNGGKLTGSKINLTLAALDIYRKFHIEVNYFTSELESDTTIPITFSTTGVGFNAFYNF